MNPHQEYLFMMLKEIDSICKKNDIQYFITQGTLIGAKRNEGFLPWDDDVDVTMTYENYVKFKETCATQLPPNRVFIAPELQESCGISLPRYTSLDTTCFHTGQSLHGCEAGEVIDIFVLDPIADGQEALDAYRANVCAMHEMVNYSGVAASRYDVPYETYQKYAAIREEKGKLAVCQQIEKEKEALFDANGSRYACRWQGVITVYQRSWFAEAVPVMFEGCELPGPIGANEYLAHYFGVEWSELPNTIDAAKHNAALSLDFPYNEALEHYKPSQDRAALRADMIERKRAVMERSETSNWLDDEVARMKAKCVQLELEKRLAKHQAEFDAAYEGKDGIALAALLADYLTAQNDKDLIGCHTFARYRRYRHPVLVDVSDRVFEAALIACLHTKRLHMANRLLAARQLTGLPLTDSMSEISHQLSLFAEATKDYEYGAFAECLAKARQLRDRDSKVSAYLKLVCLAEQRLDDTSSTFKGAFEQGLEAYPDDGFFVKMKADYLTATGKEEKARDLYIVAAENSRNGYVLHDIEQKIGYCPKWMRESTWGKSYGLPQWDAPVPDCSLPTPRKVEFEHALTPQEHLYRLLVELADFCDANNIPYALGQATGRALLDYGMQPDRVANYSLLVAGNGIERLTDALKRAQVPLRSFESKMDNPKLAEGIAYYNGEDSLLMPMGGTEPGSFNSLHITVKAIDAKLLNSHLSFVQRGLRKVGLLDTKKAFPHTNLSQDKVHGHSFRVVKGMKFKGKKPKASLAIGANDLISTSVSADEFLSAYPIAPDYFAKRQEVKPVKGYSAATLKRFRQNFKELKYAVQYKQLLHDLLPQKERILQLQADGRTKELAAVLAPYKKFIKDYKDCGEMSIDDEIYAALNSLNS